MRHNTKAAPGRFTGKSNPADSQRVSIDTFDIGKMRMTRGARNILRRNQLLAVCCLSSGHLSLEQIDSLTPNSVSGALWRMEEKFKTRIMAIYSDNYSSLRATALGVEMDKFQILRNTIDRIVDTTPGIVFNTNVSYTKSRNYIERKIKNIRSSVSQLAVFRNIILNFEEALNLNVAITSMWNNYPYSRNSLLSPSSFVNPYAELYSLQIEVIGGSITSAMKDLMEEVQKGALEFILDSQGLEQGRDSEFLENRARPHHLLHKKWGHRRRTHLCRSEGKAGL